MLDALARRTLPLRYLLLGLSRLASEPWPLYLTLFATARCDARCPHCFYWREAEDADPSRELSPDEVERIASTIPRLPVLLVGGGEPTLRADLAALCSPFVRHCRTELVILPTNGLEPEMVERSVEEVLEACRPADVRVNLSLDGPEGVHDRIRGRGAYRRLLASRRRLASLERREPRLSVWLNLTLSRLNSRAVGDAARLAARPPWRAPLSMTLARPSPRDPSVLGLGPDEVERAQAAVRSAATGLGGGFGRRPDLLARAVARVYREGRRIAPCRAGSLEAVISERGVVLPCEMLDLPLGDLREVGYDFPRVWLGERARRARREVARGRCWCTHETDLANACRFWPPLYPYLAVAGR